jgi:hypothetical protein
LTEDGETPHDLAIKHNGSECIEKLGSFYYVFNRKDKKKVYIYSDSSFKTRGISPIKFLSWVAVE